jgi:hypothetical protein
MLVIDIAMYKKKKILFTVKIKGEREGSYYFLLFMFTHGLRAAEAR